MSTLQSYAIIDANGKVVNGIDYPSAPDFIPAYPDCSAVLNTANASIGWIYVNGEFINPDPTPHVSNPLLLQPASASTLESIQAQMAALQAQLATLMAAPPAASSS